MAIRPTLFDNIGPNTKEENIYCRLKDLTNEASVETFFVNRLLFDMGYKDHHIKTKESVEKIQMSLGSRVVHYKPDYCIVMEKKPRFVVDAKSTQENIYDYIEQCAHYCLILNRRDKTKSLKYFLLSNGLKTALFHWDSEKPIVELDFCDFQIGNEKYEKLRSLISFATIQKHKVDDGSERLVELRKIDKEDAQKLFHSCHKYIWKAEKRSPSSVFGEFVKIIFLKLWHDRVLHGKYQLRNGRVLEVKKSAVTFSTHWIESRESDTLNPISDLQFDKLLKRIEDDILRKNRKRIFDEDEVIELKPQTIKGVVKKLQGVDLYGIDEDLNGRLFETFLKSTMRGKPLGQYLTPRSIVLLATNLTGLRANHEHIDKVMDACCGTGGFLIEALSEMRNQIRSNQSYSDEKKKELIKKLGDECLYGIDAATAPRLARIARINMYLHGDGGSHIYLCDGLDNDIQIDKSDPLELQHEMEDLKQNLERIRFFDVVLTNPPFSMWYESENDDDKRILGQYELGKVDESSTRTRSRLRSMAMFIERYHRLLRPGGKLLTIIDETLLSSPNSGFVRDFIRKYFLIKANISLPGDAFRMSGSRVKTALLFLEKKKNLSERQPSAFYYPSIHLGVDDLPVTSSKPKIEEARRGAEHEIRTICEEFDKFVQGKSTKYAIPSERLTDRLDLKFCSAIRGKFVERWKDDGYDVVKLSSVAKPVASVINPGDKDNLTKRYRILTIGYNGRVRADEIRKGKDINYKQMKIVKEDDLVFSEYNSIHGAIGYVTEEFEGALASGSYTIVRCENEYDTLYLWSILRTTEFRSEMLSSAVGLGRQTINWDDVKNIQIPWPSKTARKKIGQRIIAGWQAEKKAEKTFHDLSFDLNSKFNLESEESKKWFEAIKPPK